MKRGLGWTAFVLLFPVILLGAVAYMVADAAVYGWRVAENFFESL